MCKVKKKKQQKYVDFHEQPVVIEAASITYVISFK